MIKLFASSKAWAVAISLVALFPLSTSLVQAGDSKHDETSKTEAAKADAAAVSSEPQQTSATFGDWVMRCDRPAQTAKKVCEVAQSIVVKGQQGPIAQVAFGHGGADQNDAAMTLTMVLPVNISFDKQPRIGTGPVPTSGSEDPGAVKLTFLRCVPGGCFAGAKLDAAAMTSFRAAGSVGHLTFADASERTIAFPVSFHGLAQALDNLGRESTKDLSSR